MVMNDGQEQPDPGDAEIPVGGFSDTVTRGELAHASQDTPLSAPTVTPTQLPLTDLDPGVFERLVTELVTRRNNRGAHFYGRSGLKQWGLDIVEDLVDAKRELYQVRRLQTISASEIRKAVVDYAGPPRDPSQPAVPRRFDPAGFTVVTTAPFESETANVDELAALRAEYSGDLDLAVWGAEEVTRQLRGEPHLVAAVFGPPWAQAWCGMQVNLPAAAAPESLAFVESPYEILGLTTLRAEAREAEESDPLRAADRYRSLAGELTRNGFPGHGATVVRSLARALRAAGELHDAFEVLTELSVAELMTRPAESHSSARTALGEVATELGGVATARSAAIDALGSWHRELCDLPVLVPALLALGEAQDRWGPELVCLALEQAIVDGWYDHQPAESVFTRGVPDPGVLLDALRELGRSLDPVNVTIRARLRVAVADADLTWDSPPSDVEDAFQDALDDAVSGRFQKARSLVLARAAFAFAVRGDAARADSLWRQTAIAASDDRCYGDVHRALRSALRQEMDAGQLPLTPNEVLQALPNRDRLLAGAYDPALSAIEDARTGKVRDAFGDGRRFLFECRIGGQWADWLVASGLVGDVLVAVGRVLHALLWQVAAGLGDAAEKTSGQMGAFVDVRRWLRSPVERVQAAAVRSIRAQAALIPPEFVPELLGTLVEIAGTVWHHPYINPNPGREALRALIRLSPVLSADLVDTIVELVGPARTSNTAVSDLIASLLIQTYWAVPTRRADVAAVIRDLLLLEVPPHDLWELIESVPAEGRAELVPVVAELAAAHRVAALRTLAAWGVPNDGGQVMARLACASLLRNEVGVERDTWRVTTQASATVDLLVYLTGLDELLDVNATQLAPIHQFVAGGSFMQVQYGPSVAPPPPTGSPGLSTPPDPSPPEPADPPIDETVDVSDDAAVIEDVGGDDADPVDVEALKVPDDAAARAAGPVADLVQAVALHLAAVGQDSFDYGPERVNAVHALLDLVDLLDGATAADIGDRMFALHLDPNLGDVDVFGASTMDPLGAARIDMGATRLSPIALVVATSCFRRVHALDNTAVQGGTVLVNATTAALVLLSSPDDELQQLGARALTALTACSPPSELVQALLAHPNPLVRARGAHSMVGSLPLLEMFARDPAPEVRIAAARRAGELSEPMRAALAADPHAGVRATVAEALSPSS